MKHKLIVTLALSVPFLVPGHAFAQTILSNNESAISCLNDPVPVEPDRWTVADRSSISDWLSQHPTSSNFPTRQFGKKSLIALSDEDISHLDHYQQALDQLINPLQPSCVPLDLTISATNLHLTPEQMTDANVTAITTADDRTIGYRMTAIDYINQSPGPSRSVRVFRLEYNDPVGQRVPAYLLVPEDKKGHLQPGPLPGVLAIHQTISCGKRELIGACPTEVIDEAGNTIAGVKAGAFAMEFARRGFVTIAPDLIGYGELQQAMDQGLEYNTDSMRKIRSYIPDATVIGTELGYLQRAIDALFAQDIVQVKPGIGVIGHSKGGTLAPLMKVYDTRIKVALANAPGMKSLRADDITYLGKFPNGLKGSVARWCGWGYLQPMCRYDSNLQNLALDMHHVYALGLRSGSLMTVQIEDDGYPAYWNAMTFINKQAVLAAKKQGTEYRFKVIPSILRNGVGAQCLSDANGDHQKVNACQEKYFANRHGVYPYAWIKYPDADGTHFEDYLKVPVLKPLIDRMEVLLKK